VLFCEGATKDSVQNITTLIFMGGGPTRGATSRSLGNAHQKNWGKIQGGPLGVWDPRTKTKPWLPPHLADIDGTTSLT
jgi:hypothetical protein